MDIIFENFLFKNIYRLLASRFSELSLSKLVLFIFSLLLTKITTKKVSFRFIKYSWNENKRRKSIQKPCLYKYRYACLYVCVSLSFLATIQYKLFKSLANRHTSIATTTTKSSDYFYRQQYRRRSYEFKGCKTIQEKRRSKKAYIDMEKIRRMEKKNCEIRDQW